MKLLKIRKDKARELYNQEKSIIIVGDKVSSQHFFTGWALASEISIQKEHGRDFDKLINSFEFYLEPELGRRMAYYIRVG